LKPLHIFLLLLLLPLLSIGQSKKSKGSSNKRPGLFGRAYHDITARNNTYFNGNEKMKAIQRTMRDAHQDDFTEIIPVYIDRNPEAAKGASADLDEIIKKGSKVIQYHKPARWADDSYLIVGKSYFLKSDFDNSVKAFQYILTNYKEKKKKGSSSKKGKPQAASSSSASNNGSKSSGGSKKPMTAAQMKAAALEAEQKALETAEAEKEAEVQQKEKTGFDAEKYYKETFKEKLRHKPARHQAYIWLVDNYTFMGKYKEAEAVLTVLDAKGKFPFRLSHQLETARANLYMMKQDYPTALESFNTLTAKIKKSKKKNRFHFIMAQIHERDKNYSEAINNYKKSLKGRPKYDMEFAAWMSIARIGSIDQSMSPASIRKMLTKMSKDVKNKDYLDQIYYYLAELCLRESNKTCAIENFEKSVENSTTDTKQKAISHLKLADLYFADEVYRSAQENYAAAVVLLDAKYPNFSEIKYRSEVLAELVKQLDIIYEQDSLLRIARLPEKERNKFIDDLLFEKEKKEKEEKESTQQLASSPAERSNKGADDSGGAGSKSDWYFYNASLKGTGFNDFVKKWGNKRVLEDNWRRSDKRSAAFDDAQDNAEKEDEEESKSSSTGFASLDREAMLKNFPVEKVAQEKSDEMILMALYEAATIYKSKLNNNGKAILTFEELLKRYPVNKFEGQVYYNLYLLYKDENNIAKSDYYKNLLLNNFPDSPYAKIILDPNYLANLNQKTKQVEDYYKTTFGYYQSGSYDTVIAMVSIVDSLYKENNLKPKFALLNAFAIGKTQDVKTYKEALASIAETYPGDEVKTKAQEILDFLENSDTKEVRILSNVADFDYLPNDGHYFMLMFENKEIKTNDVTNVIAKWNDVNRSLEDLKINSLILKDNTTTVVVKSFKNMKTAKDYLKAITSGETFGLLPKDKLHFSIISENNFNLIVKHREIDSYKMFYESRYTE
jgi:hypothetical protein